MAVLQNRLLEARDALGHAAHVALVGDNDLRALGERRGVCGQLAVDDAVVLDGIAVLKAAGDVDDVHDERRALDMAQELVPQAATLRGALDQAGDVGDDIRVIAGADDAEVGHERGERVVGDLRPGGTHARDERRLADARHADERRVGHELHLELDPVLLGGLALLRERRGASRRRHEMGVAASSGAAGSDDDALPVMREVRDVEHDLLRVGVELADDGAHGDLEDQVLTVFAVTPGPLAVRAALGTEMMLEAVVDQRGELRVRLDDDVAAAPAVAAVRTPFGHIGLTAKRHAAGAAVAAFDVDAADICELGHRGPLSGRSIDA